MRYTTIRPKKFWRRDARGNLELSRFPLQTNNCFQLLATGGPPDVIQRRRVGRRNGEIHKTGLPGRLTLPEIRNPGQATGTPGFNFITFMPFMVKLYWLFFVNFRAFRG